MTMGVHLHFCVEVKENQGNPLYKWPSNEDQLWLKHSNLLYDVQESEKVGRSDRSYAFRPNDLELASRLMKATVPNH